MANKRPLTLNTVGHQELLQASDSLDIGGYTLPNTAGAVTTVLVMGANDAEWQAANGLNIALDDVCDNNSTTDQIITANGFVGDLTGTADNVVTNANMTGEVTSIGNATTLDPNCISGKADTTIAADDYLLFWDNTDSALKKVDANEVWNADLIVELDGNAFDKTGWEATVASEITLTFDAVAREIEVIPIGASVSYYIQGTKYTFTSSQTVSIDDVEGLWFIYFEGATLIASQIPWTFDGSRCHLFTMYWDATNKEHIGWAPEFHSWRFQPSLHGYLHNSIGTRFAEGLGVAEATANTVNVAPGTLYDEDIEITITDEAGSGWWDQVLSPLTAPIYYKTGAAGLWRRIAASTDLCYIDTGVPQIIIYDSGTWQWDAVLPNKYFVYWVVATSDSENPVYLTPGQESSDSLSDTLSGNLLTDMDFSGLPNAEHKVIARIVLQRQVASPYFEINQIDDYRYAQDVSAGVGTAVLDHGGLTGLLDDDHTQYHNDTRAAAWINSGFTTEGNITVANDSIQIIFGAGSDYSIEWDGANAVHTVNSGQFNFVGGAVSCANGFVGDLTGTADNVVTNANMTGEVTSIGNATALDPTSISGKADTTINSSDYLLFWDATDSVLKKVDAGELIDDLDDVCDRGATTDQTITAGGFDTTGSVNTPTVHNSAGALAIAPNGEGAVNLFEDYDCGALESGKGLAIYRKSTADGGTHSLSMYLSHTTVAYLASTTAVRFTAPLYAGLFSTSGYVILSATTDIYMDIGENDDLIIRNHLGGTLMTIAEATGDIHFQTDSQKLHLGASDDYNITWDGTNAVHTITAGAFEFDGGAIRVPNFTTVQRDALTPANGMVIYNTTTTRFEYYENGSWVAKATVITTTTNLYVATTGNDTTGDGSSGAPWATVDKALEVVGTWVLIADVTINIAAGSYATATTLTINHSQGGKLNIAGDTYYDAGAALTATNTTGAYSDYTFTSGDSTKYTVGQKVLIISASGGTNPTYCVGTLEVISISAPSVVLRWYDVTAAASGAVLANIYVPRVEWVRPIVINSSVKLISGIQVKYNCTSNIILCYINPAIPTKVQFQICIFSNTNATQYGQFSAGKGSFTECYAVGFFNMYFGIISSARARFEYSGCFNCALGFYVYVGSVVTTANIHMIGTTGVALTAYGQAVIQPDATGSVMINNGTDAVPANGAEGNRNSRMDY